MISRFKSFHHWLRDSGNLRVVMEIFTAIIIFSVFVFIRYFFDVRSGYTYLPWIHAQVDKHLNKTVVLPIACFFLFLLIIKTIHKRTLKNDANIVIYLLIIIFILFATFLHISVAYMDGGTYAIKKPVEKYGSYYDDIGRIDGLKNFLKDFVSLMPYLTHHSTTHPPGPIILLWTISKITGDDVLLIALVMVILSNLSIIPLYFLARDLYGKKVAFYASIFYILAPNVIIYSATSIDAIIPFFVISSAYFFYKGIRLENSFYIAFSGLMLALGLFMTFAILPLILLFTLWATFFTYNKSKNVENIQKDRFLILKDTIKSTSPILGIMLGTLTLFYGLLYILTGFNIIDCFFMALENNEKSSAAHRRYSIWVWGNIIIFLFYVGITTTVFYLRELNQTLSLRKLDPYLISFILVFLLTTISGVVKGEVERVWLFFASFIIIPAAKNLSEFIDKNNSTFLLYFSAILLFLEALAIEIVFETYW